MAYQKQDISFQQAARMATIFSDEVIKSFKKLIGRKIYKQDRDAVHDYLVARALAVLHRRFRIVYKSNKRA